MDLINRLHNCAKMIEKLKLYERRIMWKGGYIEKNSFTFVNINVNIIDEER